MGISIAGIITTVIMAGRKALVKGGQALGSFRKSMVNMPGICAPEIEHLKRGNFYSCPRIIFGRLGANVRVGKFLKFLKLFPVCVFPKGYLEVIGK